jgi:hypothetical protein
MVFSAVSGVQTPITATATPKIEMQYKENAPKKEEVAKKLSVEEYVRTYFQDIPVMADIAYCESRFRQFDKDGEIFRGKVNNKDVGVMQINEFYHLDTAEEANYNIYTLEGNTAYARKLYEKFGTDPWNSSRPCWGPRLDSQLARNK